MSSRHGKTLVLGLGNVIMGDEGVGVHVVRELEHRALPEGVECLDGGTGGFLLLEPLESAERIMLIDAAADGNPPGTVTRTEPRFAADYPPTLTAHDIGVKDLLDALYLRGNTPDITLYAISIDPRQPISMQLSETIALAAQGAVRMILAELRSATVRGRAGETFDNRPSSLFDGGNPSPHRLQDLQKSGRSPGPAVLR